MALLLPVALVGKTSVSMFMCYFSSHPLAFGLWASSPQDNFMLKVDKKKTEQSFRISDWHQSAVPLETGPPIFLARTESIIINCAVWGSFPFSGLVAEQNFQKVCVSYAQWSPS